MALSNVSFRKSNLMHPLSEIIILFKLTVTCLGPRTSAQKIHLGLDGTMPVRILKWMKYTFVVKDKLYGVCQEAAVCYSQSGHICFRSEKCVRRNGCRVGLPVLSGVGGMM